MPYKFHREVHAAAFQLVIGGLNLLRRPGGKDHAADRADARVVGDDDDLLVELPDDVADDIDVLFVSVDAVNDDTEQLASYLDNFDASFVGLTGTAAEVNAALTSVGLPPTAIADAGAFPPAHPSYVLAYTEDGRAHVAYPFGTSPAAYTADMRALRAHDWS